MQDVFVRFFVTFQLLLICMIAYGQGQVENNAPVVKIIKPKITEVLNRNTLIPYIINVNDVEDGNSAYEEIAGREVILIVKYLEDSSLVDNYLKKIDQDLAILFIMSKSTCLNCHTSNSKLIGPSFDLIAKKYSENDFAKTYLTGKVMTGGTGIWGEEKMPPNPDLSKEEVELLVDWILKQEDKPTQFYIGLEGAFRTNKAEAITDKSVYILTATYKDRGFSSPPKNQKSGLQTIKLKVRH